MVKIYSEWLNELKENKRIVIPQNYVYPFREYAKSNGVFSQGAGIVGNMRTLYID